MLAYNLNCWLMLVPPGAADRRHRTAPHDFGHSAVTLPVLGCQDLATRRRTGISYSDHYEEKGAFERLTV